MPWRPPSPADRAVKELDRSQIAVVRSSGDGDFHFVNSQRRRLPLAVRADGRVRCRVEFGIIRAKRLRLAVSAIVATMLPGVDRPCVFHEVVVKAVDGSSIAAGTESCRLSITGHRWFLFFLGMRRHGASTGGAREKLRLSVDQFRHVRQHCVAVRTCAGVTEI